MVHKKTHIHNHNCTKHQDDGVVMNEDTLQIHINKKCVIVGLIGNRSSAFQPDTFVGLRLECVRSSERKWTKWFCVATVAVAITHEYIQPISKGLGLGNAIWYTCLGQQQLHERPFSCYHENRYIINRITPSSFFLLLRMYVIQSTYIAQIPHPANLHFIIFFASVFSHSAIAQNRLATMSTCQSDFSDDIQDFYFPSNSCTHCGDSKKDNENEQNSLHANMGSAGLIVYS